jgi:hypothetical protein
MASPLISETRAGNTADVLRVVVAIGILALLAWFDGGDRPVARSLAATEIAGQQRP